MQLGAATVQAGPEVDSQLGEYGRNLGLAFQIVDDVLDLTAAEDILGKPVASDLREGKATLAVIHALERGTGADREAIRTVLNERSFATVPHAQILEILERHGLAWPTRWTLPALTQRLHDSPSLICPKQTPSAPCSGCPRLRHLPRPLKSRISRIRLAPPQPATI